MRGLDSLDSMTGLLSPRFEKFDSDHIANYVSNPGRCFKLVRGLALTGCAVFCVLLYTSVATHSDWRYAPSSVSANTTSAVKTPTIPIKPTQPKDGIKGSLWNTKKPQYYTIHSNEPYDIDVALRRVLNLCPDEVYYDALTQPIKTVNEEKLHETGVRVRMFKKYFDAWEALHVVTDSLSDTAFVRDDILRHIRDSKDISSFTSSSRVEAMRQYEAYRSFLSNMSSILFPWTSPYFSDHMTLHGHMYNAGRGIVISGSNSQAPYIKTAITSFRAMGCTLPVEIMYLGEEDLSEDTRTELEIIPDVITRNLKKMVDDQGWEIKGWAGKAHAAFMSSFREVILLDADVLFFDNPELMFDEPGYVDTGALFFSDRTIFPQDKRTFLRKILPKPVSSKARENRWWKGESGEGQEAGVVVVDKWRHFLSVFLTTRLNGPDRDDTDTSKGTYSFWWGDKETWWISFELAGDTDYHFHAGGTGNIGTVSNTEPVEKPEEKHEEEEHEEEKHEEKNEEQKTEDKSEEQKTEGKSEEQKTEDTASKEDLHKTDAEDFSENLRSLQELQSNKPAEPTTAQPAEEKKASDAEAQSNIPSPSPAPDADTVMKAVKAAEMRAIEAKEMDAIKAAEAERAARLPIEEGQYLPVPNNTQPADSPTVNEPATTSEQSATVEGIGRARSRRHLTKRGWYDDALSTKRTNLTGPGMLDLPGQNIILCAPQLLHLSTESRPLWFNGWIQDNKHQASSNISVFEFFMTEKRKDGEWAEWAIGADNMCCLKGDDLHALNDKELRAMKMIVDIAKENGSLHKLLEKEKKANKNNED